MFYSTEDLSYTEFFIRAFGSCTFGFMVFGIGGSYAYFKFGRKHIYGFLRVLSPWGIKPTSFLPLFVNALIFSIVVEITLHGLRDKCNVVGLVNAELAAADWAMNVWVRREPALPSDLEPFVWVDIDEDSYREMREPLTIPRTSILELVERAVCAPAKLIIVDIALDRYISPTNETMREADESVSRYLRYYSEKASEHLRRPVLDNRTELPGVFECIDRDREARYPHVILAKALKIKSPDALPPYEERRSEIARLENIVDESPVLHWASTTFEYDHDYIVRKWHLFEPTYKAVEKGRGYTNSNNTLPSIPLLAWAILRQPDLGNKPFGSVKKFKEDLKIMFPPTDELSTNTHSSWLTKILRCARKEDSWTLKKKLSDGTEQSIQLRRNPSDAAQRVAYLIGNLREPWAAPSLNKTDSRKEAAPLIARLPAWRLLSVEENSTDTISINQSYLKDKVVVIGSSYEDSRDFHLTPVGRMPGALWMINAIESLMEHGEMRPAPFIQRWSLILLSLLIVSCIFAQLHSRPLLATLCTSLIMLAFVIYGLRGLSTGAWLDFTMPYFGVLIHFLVEQASKEEWLHSDPSAH